MQFDLANLPSDTALLHHLVRDMAALVEHRDDEIERLQQIIRQLQRAQYGRRSERLDPDQLTLALEDLESDLAGIAENRPILRDKAGTTRRRKKLVKIGAKVVRHGRYVAFQMAEVAVPRRLLPRSCG